MKLKLKDIPRKFKIGQNEQIEISDYGKILLEPNEMVSFIKESGKEYDVTAKSWGFYATSSINGRLKNEGFKTALVKNSYEKYYIMIVEIEKMSEFNAYLKEEKNEVEEWLDEKN